MTMTARKLIVDIEKCLACPDCVAACDYYFHPENRGYVRCLALAAQEHVCRRCEDKPCAAACPQQALEPGASGMLNRYSLRCTSCKTCTVACPFGVIHPGIVEYRTAMCDYCADRCDDRREPLCVRTCPRGALSWADPAGLTTDDVHPVRGGAFYAKVHRWREER